MSKKYKQAYRKSPYMVRKALKELRMVIDGHPDTATQRIAYAVECGIRWATEETAGWSYPAQDAISAGELIKSDLSPSKGGEGE
jgi:hypothetical protein